MHRGFVKIWRKINNWDWYKSSETFHLFVHLLLNANYQDSEHMGVSIKRGQILTGRKTLSEKTGISERSIRTSLNRLKTTKEITIKTTNRFSIITICNYETYNPNKNDTNQQSTSRSTNKTQKTDQQIDQQNTQINNCNINSCDQYNNTIDQQIDQQNTKNRPTDRPHHRIVKKEEKNKNTLSVSSKPDNGFDFNKNTNPTEFDKQASKYLEKAVRKLPPRKTGITKAKPFTWATHIQKLRTIDGIEEKEIKLILKWYSQHIGEEFVPEAFSGESFRKKYPAIVRQYEKEIPLPVKTSPEALQIVEHLNTLSWPSKSIETLPTAVQSSLTAYEEWLSSLKKYSEGMVARHKKWVVENLPPGRNKTAPRNTQFAAWLISTIPDKQHFIRGWFEEVHKNTRNWFEWNGDLSRFCFRIDNNKRFQAIGRKWASEFCSDPDLWDWFCDEMNESKNEKHQTR